MELFRCPFCGYSTSVDERRVKKWKKVLRRHREKIRIHIREKHYKEVISEVLKGKYRCPGCGIEINEKTITEFGNCKICNYDIVNWFAGMLLVKNPEVQRFLK